MNSRSGLFGLNNTNRDFSLRETWGKNQFNSSFPASLCCYLSSRNMKANYLSILNRTFAHNLISIENVFGIEFNNKDTLFSFEMAYAPYQKYITGLLPRTDLVVQRQSSGECLAGLEIKLTALPDNVTCNMDEGHYGCEIVVRPDTIVYLACSIAKGLSKDLGCLIPDVMIQDWSDINLVLEKSGVIVHAIKELSVNLERNQMPFLLQPIWKTIGKSPELSTNCLDIFVWSNAGFCYFISEIASANNESKGITRQKRTAIWLFKMLSDIKLYGKFNHKNIIDQLSFNTKNDKAFASSGNVTNKYMTCERLIKPAILKSQIKEIILGGGQHLLSPERRFDAILFNTPGLF